MINSEKIKKESTIVEGIYRYYAPEGYVFWHFDSCFGSVIYGGDKLDNNYELRKKDG